MSVAKAYKIARKIYDNIVTALFLVIICCVVLQIFARYVLQVAIPWTEELARYTLVITAFSGAVIAFRKGGHLGVYFLRDLAKGRLRGFMYTFSNFGVLVVLVLIIFGALEMRSAVAGQDASTMGWFMQSWLYNGCILGFSLMFFYSLRDCYLSILALMGKKEISTTGISSPQPEED